MPAALLAALGTGLAGALGNALAGIATTIGTLLLVKTLLVGLTSLLANGIDSLLSIPVHGNPLVEEGWGITRNFANMFFIIGLIIMAFGTIFNIRGYELRSLIVRFLIAALLINFSLVIGELLIEWSQSLSNVFITAIGDIGSRIAQGLELAKTVEPFQSANLSSVNAGAVDVTLWQKTIDWIASIGLLAIVAFSMAVFFITLIARVIALWALLILAPIAWIAYVLPQTNYISKKWWTYFISWNIFLPIYLFFIYFGFLFLQKKSTVLSTISANNSSNMGITFQSLFFYILVATFFIGGAKIAISASRAGGAGAVAGAVWARGRTMARFAGVGVAKRLPGSVWAQGKYQGTQQWFAQMNANYKKKVEAEGDAWAKKLGVEGADVKRFMKNVEEALKKMRDNGDVNKKMVLENILKDPTSSPSQIVAAGKLLKEFHVDELDKDQVAKMSGAYSKAGIAEQSKYLASVNYDKQSADDLNTMLEPKYLDDNVDPAFRNKFKSRVADALIKKRRYGDMNSYMALLSNYGENEDDIVDAINRTDKDFLEGMSRDEAFDMFNGLNEVGPNKKKMVNAQKIIAERMLKKGYFAKEGKMGADGKLEKAGLENIMKLTKNGGIYDSDLEIKRALKLAEETRLVSALELREQLGLLDTDADGKPKAPEQVLKDRVQRLNADALLKVRVDEISDKNGTLTAGGEKYMAEVEAMLKKNPKRIATIANHVNYTGEYQALYEKMFERIQKENQARIKAKNKKGSNASAGESTLPQPPQYLGGSTIIGGPEEKPVPTKKENRTQGQIIIPPEAQFKLDQERRQASGPEEERTERLVAEQGYVGFILKESADLFRDKHSDWIESKIGNEWQFKPPVKK